MDVIVKQVHRHEVPPELSYWFAMYDELWLVESIGHHTHPTDSKEDALEYIIKHMTEVDLEVQ